MNSFRLLAEVVLGEPWFWRSPICLPYSLPHPLHLSWSEELWVQVCGGLGEGRRTLGGGKESTTRGGTLGGWASQPPSLDNVARSQCRAIGRPAICRKSGLSGAHWHQLRVTILLEEKPLVDWASHNYIDLLAKFQNPSNSQIGPGYLDIIIVSWKLLFLFLHTFCVRGVLFFLSVYLGDVCFSFMFVTISHWSLSVIYCALTASLLSNFKTKLFWHKTVVMMGDAHGGIHQFKLKHCCRESDGHNRCCHQHCDESRCQSSFSRHTEIRMSRRADEEGAGGEDWLLVPATLSYLGLLCISALVKAATPHSTHLMAALSCPLLNPNPGSAQWPALW